MGILNAKERKALPKSEFGLPGKRAFPSISAYAM